MGLKRCDVKNALRDESSVTSNQEEWSCTHCLMTRKCNVTV